MRKVAKFPICWFYIRREKYAEQMKGTAAPRPQPVSGHTQSHRELGEEQHFLTLECSQLVLSQSTFC